MKYNKTLRTTIESLIKANENNKNIIEFLKLAYPDNLIPNLNVCFLLFLLILQYFFFIVVHQTSKRSPVA
jgi:hypothetical protein